MVDGLTVLITSQGWMAPFWYVGGFLLAALVPVIPTPLIAALGGTAFGSLPAIVYGVIGRGVGAVLSLTLARRLGLPLVRRIVPATTLSQWEALLGIRSPWTWGVIFLVVNLDVAVMASGLSTLPLRQLWFAAMLARLPWLVGSAVFGDLVLVNDGALLAILVLMVPVLWGVNRARPAIGRLLSRWIRQRDPGASPAVPPARDGRAGGDDR